MCEGGVALLLPRPPAGALSTFPHLIPVPPLSPDPAPCDSSVPPCDSSVPPCDSSVPPCDSSVPPCDSSVPPCDSSVPPCDTSVPPCEHSIPSIPGFWEKYCFKEVLGAGHFGEVWRCIDRGTGQHWACKEVQVRGASQWRKVSAEVECMRALAQSPEPCWGRDGASSAEQPLIDHPLDAWRSIDAWRSLQSTGVQSREASSWSQDAGDVGHANANVGDVHGNANANVGHANANAGHANANVGHVNVVALREAHREGDSVYLVLELCEGGDLFEAIALRGHASGLPERTCQQIFFQVARGLAHCHARGFLHRDIKPENVLLQEHLDDSILDTSMPHLEPLEDTNSENLLPHLDPLEDIKPEDVLLQEQLESLPGHAGPRSTASTAMQGLQGRELPKPHPETAPLHGQLKSESLVCGPMIRAKLADFGLACDLSKGRGVVRGKCGSPQYSAPEVMLGHDYSFPADIWSLGVLLYAMLHADWPERDAAGAVRLKAQGGQVGVSFEAQDLLARMLVVDPGQRPTIEEILVHPWQTVSC